MNVYLIHPNFYHVLWSEKGEKKKKKKKKQFQILHNPNFCGTGRIDLSQESWEYSGV